MNKLDVISKLIHKTGINETDIKIILETFLATIQEALMNGEEVHIKNFGKFLNKKRRTKIGRNLTNNTALTIPEHYIPTLKLSREFVKKIKISVPV